MTDLLSHGAPLDVDLVRAAQAGDAGSLGLLLARHQATMHGVALALLGHSPDAQDAVQEAALIALRRIGDLRDPEAAGAWLRMVVRNVCRAQPRKKSAVPVAELEGLVAMDRSGGPSDPADVLDEHVLRNWIWSAMEELSPGLRLVTMPRYFTDVTSYEEIALPCGAPVGTVRSRLHQARARLAGALVRMGDQVHDDATSRTARHRPAAHRTPSALTASCGYERNPSRGGGRQACRRGAERRGRRRAPGLPGHG